MSNGMHQIDALMTELSFEVVNEDTAIGDVGGIPTAMSLLGSDPPAVLFQLRINPAEAATLPEVSELSALTDGRAKISIEDDSAWVSIHDTNGIENSAIRQLLEKLAGAIHSSGLAPSPGCSKCGSVENGKVIYAQGRARRVCDECLSAAVSAQKVRESELNRGSLLALVGLPGTVVLAAGGWALFWTILDLMMEYMQVRAIWINKLTFLVYFVVLVGAGYTIGRPLGIALRKSIGANKAGPIASGLFALAVAVGGEILYIAILMLRFVGVFNLREATRLLGLILADYSPFWILCKLGLLVTIGVCCKSAVDEYKQTRLDV